MTRFLLLSLMFLLPFCSVCAENNVQMLRNAARWSREFPQEKVYLHLDNTGYFKGETIWFKAYVTRTDTGRRGNLSRVLYVELLSGSGELIDKKTVLISHGIGAGQITLDKKVMPAGFYTIRAYTRYMTNWGTNACFSRTIPIFEEPKVAGAYRPVMGKQSVLLKPEVQDDSHYFYPEGGYIVQGIPSRVAYSINGERGVLEIPATQTSRDVEITIDGKSKKYRLPEFRKEGISMRVDAVSTDDVGVDFWSTPSFFGEHFEYVFLNNGKIKDFGEIVASEHTSAVIPAERVAEGVSQIVLYDATGNIVAERFIFRCPKEEANLQVTNMTKTLLPCGKVVMDIQSTPYTSLSFSAMDAASMPNGQYGNIRTWMLLGSEIKGYIAHPEYYFESDDQEHRKASDLLMMIQGWRRYDWEMMVGKRGFENPQIIEEQLCFYGTIKPKRKKDSVAGVSVTATLHGSGEHFSMDAVTDSTGFYSMRLPDIQGEWIMNILTARNGKKSDYIIPIERHFAPKRRPISQDELQVVAIDTTVIHKWEIPQEDEYVWKKFLVKQGTLMQEINVKGKHENHYGWSGYTDETEAENAALLYYNCEEAAEEIADRGEETPGLVTWLKEKNPEVFSGNDPTDKLLWFTKSRMSTLSDDEQSILDFFNRPMYRNIFNALEISGHAGTELPVEVGSYEMNPPAGWLFLWSDGLRVKNRPVVWIVDNHFASITNMTRKILDTGGMDEAVTDNANRMIEMPYLLDEVKSIYVSDNLEKIRSHIATSEVANINPMVVYCYTYRNRVKLKEKGVRYTHFQGYDPVETFTTEDYTDLPPVDDFRRTLFWEPNIWTDAEGRARVEFWNNSTCNGMVISAEGITDDGHFVVGK